MQQVRARGADLDLRTPPLGAEATGAVRVEVSVDQPAPSELVAEVQLRSPGGQELRRVQARACSDLRSAVAWVLVVLAQQSASDRGAPLEPETGASSTGVFPEPTLTVPHPLTGASLPPPVPSPFEPAASPENASSPARSAHTRAGQVSSWGLGFAFSGAFGLLPAPAFGPMLLGRYQPPVAWLPALQLSVQRLVTSDFKSNGTSISLTRDVARLGAWAPVVRSALNLGIAAEAGRLAAAGSGPTLEHGSSDSALWFAFAVPLRLSLPLVGRFLQADLQLELDYSPVPYTFRYGSGDTLTSTAPFEGRGQLGLTSLF